MSKPPVASKHTNEHGTQSYSAPVSITNLINAVAEVLITRPSNAAPYSANDVIGVADAVTPANAGSAILKFADIGPAGGIVKIVGAELLPFLAALPAGMGSFTLHLFDSPPDARLDNALWDISSAGDRAKFLGSLVIGTPAKIGGVGSTIYVETAFAKQVKLAAGSTDLYGVLQTVGAYTPTSGEQYKVRLHAECKS